MVSMSVPQVMEAEIMIHERLFSLLRFAIGSELEENPMRLFQEMTESDWEEVYHLARKQTVTGLVFHALTLSPEKPPGLSSKMLYRWALEAERLEKRSRIVFRFAEELLYRLESAGLRPLVMKGPSVAAYYPKPLLRESGDIDLYVSQNEISAALECLHQMGYSFSESADGGYYVTGGSVDIDLHDKYFDLHVKDELLPPVPSPQAELMMLSSHILKHAMGPGVGLRQICDLALAYKALEGMYEKRQLVLLFKRYGLDRWNRLLCSFMKARLGMDAQLYSTDVRWNSLEMIVFGGGNFGHYSASRNRSLGAGSRRRKLDTVFRFVRHAPWGLHYAPKEYFCYMWDLAQGNLAG